ncbi:MAG: hypothetical protein V1824_03890 [archaeon]
MKKTTSNILTIAAVAIIILLVALILTKFILLKDKLYLDSKTHVQNLKACERSIDESSGLGFFKKITVIKEIKGLDNSSNCILDITASEKSIFSKEQISKTINCKIPKREGGIYYLHENEISQFCNGELIK